MCGISGFLSFNGQVKENALRQMSEAVKHRGPDDEGIYLGRANPEVAIGLAHRRLSIIDLSEKGHQPMEAGNTVLVYNGEIYNYQQLKEELVRAGYEFKSQTDTEVIALGYRHWGESLWGKLEGMFAFALWDKKKNLLFLVRDSFGIKPLYYYKGAGYFLFSSEIKGLLASGMVPRQMNKRTLYHFLSYFYTPGPETIIEGVRHVRPGTRLLVDLRGNLREDKFTYAGANRIDTTDNLREADFFNMLRAETGNAVKSSMVADVPVGLVLSGGMDSNVVLHEMKNACKERIQTFTVGFDDLSFDESQQARFVSEFFAVENIQSRFKKDELPKYYDEVVYYHDSLSANPAAIPVYLFFKLASDHVKVVLSGTGGDELLGGYFTYIADVFNRYYQRLPLFLRKAIHGAVNMLPVSHGLYSFDYLSKKFTEGALFKNPDKGHYWWRTIFTDMEKEALLSRDFINELGKDDLDSFLFYERELKDIPREGISLQERYMRSDFNLFLIENAVRMFDNLSMAHSIECRPPFLHQRYVQFCRSVSTKHKIKGFSTKYCLRESYRAHLPKGVSKRRKRGLLSPLADAFCSSLKPFLEENLSEKHLKDIGYFNYPYVRKLMDDHYEKRSDNSFRLNVLLSFMRWHGMFIKGNR